MRSVICRFDECALLTLSTYTVDTPSGPGRENPVAEKGTNMDGWRRCHVRRWGFLVTRGAAPSSPLQCRAFPRLDGRPVQMIDRHDVPIAVLTDAELHLISRRSVSSSAISRWASPTFFGSLRVAPASSDAAPSQPRMHLRQD
jgi:hypothetical protein